MACCAAAAFFISQIVLAFEGVRRRLFGARSVVETRNDAVAWTPGASSTAKARRRVFRPHRLLVAALVAEALLIAGTAGAWSTSRTSAGEQDLWSQAMSSICTSGSPEESRMRLTNWIEGRAQ